MKNYTKGFLVVWLALSCLEALGDNWHPFPFQRTYYSRREALPGIATGRVVDALQLDSSWTLFSGGTGKGRKKVALETPYIWEKPFEAMLQQTQVLTSFDSSTVYFYNIQFFNNFNNGNDTMEFYLNNRLTGQKGFHFAYHSSMFSEPDLVGNGTITGYSIDTILGMEDSVRLLEIWGQEVKWSKKFGLLNIPQYRFAFLGAVGLSSGFQEPEFIPSQAYPTMSDTIHTRRIYTYVRQCPSHAFSVYREVKEVRATLMEYPYQGNTQWAKYKVIYSDSGSSTGIEAHEILNIGQFEVRSIGDFSSMYFYPFWLDDNQMLLRITAQPLLIDAGSGFGIFPMCKISPFIGRTGTIVENCVGAFWASDFTTLTLYPLYMSGGTQCSFGHPLPPVVVTETSSPLRALSSCLYPNPGKTLRYEGEPGRLELTDGLGRTFLSKPVAEKEEVDVLNLPPGLYHYQVRYADGGVSQGKWVKE